MTSLFGFKPFCQPLIALFSFMCTAVLLQADDATKTSLPATPAANALAPNFQFGIARMSDISQASSYFKDLQTLVMEKRKDLEKQYIEFRKKFDTKIKKIQASIKSGVNAEKIKEKQLELQKEGAAAEKKFQQQQQEIQNFQQTHTMDILRLLRLLFKTVGEKHNLSIVFDADGTLYVNMNQAVDVTSEVLAQLNATYDKKIFAKERAELQKKTAGKESKKSVSA